MKNKILIIDDDEELSEELADMLRGLSYDVVTISEPHVAVDHVNKNPPDAILLDLRMKEMTGFEIAALLRHNTKTAGIPIIAMSGYYTLKEHEFLATICGINRFLKKPINLSDLIMQLEDILSERGALPSTTKQSL